MPERSPPTPEKPKGSEAAARPAESKPTKAPDTAADSKPTAIGDE
jgi:hypothetical protein